MTFDKKLNLDTASEEKINETQNELVDYLSESGEKIASETVQNLIDSKSDTIINQKTDPNVYKNLLVNQKILEVLKKIHADMIDEQDTSIKGVPGANKINRISSVDNQSVSEGAGIDLGLPDLDFHRRLKLPKQETRKERRKRILKERELQRKEREKQESKKTSNQTPKTDKKKPPIKTSNSLGKTAMKALRFAKAAGPIGAVITAGLAIYDGVQGWQNAGVNLGIDEKDLTTTNKLASALGGALTLGIGDEKEAAKGMNNLLGGNPVIEKYENLKIINHNTFGSSEITNWKEFSTLPPNEQQKIIDIDDWEPEDLERMQNIKITNIQNIKKQKEIKERVKETQKETTKVEHVNEKSKDKNTVKYVLKSESTNTVNTNILGVDGKDGANAENTKIETPINGKDGVDGKDGQNSVSVNKENNNVQVFVKPDNKEVHIKGDTVESVTIIKGKDGADGKNGLGADGKDGESLGADGKDGIDGVNAVKSVTNNEIVKHGKDGESLGTDGKDGIDGQNSYSNNIENNQQFNKIIESKLLKVFNIKEQSTVKEIVKMYDSNTYNKLFTVMNEYNKSFTTKPELSVVNNDLVISVPVKDKTKADKIFKKYEFIKEHTYNNQNIVDNVYKSETNNVLVNKTNINYDINKTSNVTKNENKEYFKNVVDVSKINKIDISKTNINNENINNNNENNFSKNEYIVKNVQMNKEQKEEIVKTVNEYLLSQTVQYETNSHYQAVSQAVEPLINNINISNEMPENKNVNLHELFEE